MVYLLLLLVLFASSASNGAAENAFIDRLQSFTGEYTVVLVSHQLCYYGEEN